MGGTDQKTAALGLNPDDRGARMLGDALRDVDPASSVLVVCGDLPGLRSGAARLILDAAELEHSVHRLVSIVDAASVGSDARYAAVWPRAHLGKDFTEHCLAVAARSLGMDGQLLCAVRKRKGADSIARTMEQLLGNVEVVRRGGGYRLYRAVRHRQFAASLAEELIGRRYTIRDPVLGDLELASAPGVFSRRELDAGTRCLIDHVAAAPIEVPGLVVDLCAGVGPLGLWAARRWSTSKVLAVESNLLAVELLEENATAAGVGTRMRTIAGTALPPPGPGELADLILVNPPTHASHKVLTALLGGLRPWLGPRSRTYVVAARPESIARILARSAGQVRIVDHGRYGVIEASGRRS